MLSMGAVEFVFRLRSADISPLEIRSGLRSMHKRFPAGFVSIGRFPENPTPIHCLLIRLGVTGGWEHLSVTTRPLN